MNVLQIDSESAIEHLLEHKPSRLKSITLYGEKNARLDGIERRARELRIPCHREIKEKGKTILAALSPFEYTDFKAFKDTLGKSPDTRQVVLALDHLQDSQNFGSLCRTAEALGVKGILLPKDRSVIVSSGVYTSSVGAVETIPVVQVANLNEALRQLKEMGLWIVGTALGTNTHPLEETPDFEKSVLVMGNELDGLSDHTAKICDWLIEIPMRGKVQSLNVAVSGGIILYHLSNQRGK